MPGSSNAFDSYGAFKSLFVASSENPPSYLSLLNLHIGVQRAVRELMQALRASGPDLERSIIALLCDEAGWRPQLVGAAALVAWPTSTRCIEALWTALDHTCWTSPQLAAAAFRVDPNFYENARPRLVDRCRVTPLARQIERMPPSAARDLAIQGRSDPKLLGALSTLCLQHQQSDAWLSQLLAAPDVALLLSEDRDGGGSIALNWLTRLDEAIGEEAS